LGSNATEIKIARRRKIKKKIERCGDARKQNSLEENGCVEITGN